jgi:hypothetical protein
VPRIVVRGPARACIGLTLNARRSASARRQMCSSRRLRDTARVAQGAEPKSYPLMKMRLMQVQMSLSAEKRATPPYDVENLGMHVHIRAQTRRNTCSRD